jgi:D-alanyl-D-alanine carboxypeptidase
VPGYAGGRDPLGLPDEVMTNGTFVINPQFEWTGGGYATSARDLARWGHALYAGNAISPKARDLMISSAVPARLGPETKYGLGVIVRGATPAGPTVGHSGFFPGYQTELVHFVTSGVTMAVQINSSAPRPQGTRAPLRFLYDLALLMESGAQRTAVVAGLQPCENPPGGLTASAKATAVRRSFTRRRKPSGYCRIIPAAPVPD